MGGMFGQWGAMERITMLRFASTGFGASAVCFGRWLLPVLLVMSVWLVAAGCRGGKQVRTPAASPPPPMFRGPKAFHGTVGSMARVPAEDTMPILVSNHWVVAGLDGTGSSDVPRALMPGLVNELGRKGLGRESKRTRLLTPQRLLGDPSTAVVTVEGLIPGGATRGDPFDLLLTAEQSQTTSLEGGRLFLDVDLSPLGTRPDFVRPYGRGTGATYLDPFEDDVSREQRRFQSRVAAVLSGGEVTRDRTLRLVLNQSSARRCRIIADRIIERFGKSRDAGDTQPIAVPKTDSLIELHVPRRWRGQTPRLLTLIMHLYVQREFDFEPEQAEKLAQLVREDPDQYANRVALAWEALGPNALSVIGGYYDHADVQVRLAALQAGSHLHDERASRHLAKLSVAADPAHRRRVAELMVYLPDSLVAGHTLRTLLDDGDRSVRIAAYKALSETGNMDMIQRVVFRTKSDQFKFILDIVDAKSPLILISQTGLPRVVVFNSFTGFKPHTLVSLWDNKLMVKTSEENEPAEVYYLASGMTEGRRVEMLPFVVHLVKYMAQTDTLVHKGLNLSYSRVVNALYQAHRAGHLDTELEIEPSPLAEMIARYRKGGSGSPRPETDQPEAPAVPEDDQIARKSD